MPDAVCPYPKDFPSQLQSYCEQIGAAIAARQHHDTRRALFLNFLHVAFDIQPTEVELEHKVKVGELRGRIDALYKHIIVEVKTDFDAERPDAERELKKYFGSRQRPIDYIGLVTDGLRIEAWHYNRLGQLHPISETTLRGDQPLEAWRWLDQFLSTAIRLVPTSDELAHRFGPDSAIYNTAADRLLALYERVEREPLVAVKFREWNALLAKVYGSPLGKPALFINHTYLTLLSRILVTLALGHKAPKRKELRGLLDGSWFARQLNLTNLAEPDFFSWALETDAEAGFLELLSDLFQRFAVYAFDDLAEDVLKNLYQQLVDPETRHDLGEYYTPDWLAQLTLERLGYTGGKMLDPTCGSGGFIFAGVQCLRAAGHKGADLVRYALENIIGVDVHPVAVLMAKANLLLALRRELRDYDGEVTLRIYMADMLMADEDTKKGLLRVRVSAREGFNIPLATVARGELDDLIDVLSDFAHRGSKDEDGEAEATKAVETKLAGFDTQEAFYWRQNFKLLLRLDRAHRNTIWAYILKNAYRPVFLRREKVDVVAGNPPWLSYRYLKDETYKARVKELTFAHGLLGKDERKLFTQMDTSTLFVAQCEREFLRPGGVLGMVLPKTVILPAKQHLAFQRAGFTEVHDFTGVEPLFNVRTCMIIRRAPYSAANVPRYSWSGKLANRNLSLRDARPSLSVEEDTVSFDAVAGEYSPYYALFLNGATLWPRCLVFVEPDKDAVLNTKAPFVRTSAEAHAESKKNWRMEVEGNIEREFLFGTVLAKDLIPFVVRKLSLVALPLVENSHGDLNVVDSGTLLGEGCKHAYDWFAQAETKWREGRTDVNFELPDWLNYQNKLTAQSLSAPFIVLTNKSGTNLSVAMLTAAETKKIGRLPIQGFVVENVTYRYYANSEAEAHYLVGILNTTVVNDLIKPLQPQGLMGERDIHRRPFEACNIPLFDPADPLHQEIAAVSAAARAELLPHVSKLQVPVAAARAWARERVADQLAHLDTLTRRLLHTAPTTARAKKSTTAQPDLL